MSHSEEQKLELEVVLTEHERVLEQFSQLFQDQQSQMDRLSMRVEMLERRLSAGDEGSQAEEAHEPPPHY